MLKFPPHITIFETYISTNLIYCLGDEGDEKTDADASEGNTDDKNHPKDDENDDNNGSGGNPEGSNDDDGVGQKSPDKKDDQR